MRSKICFIVLLALVMSGSLHAQVLLAEYYFTGASGADSSGNNNNGTIHGSSTTGNALVIGSNILDYFSMPAAPLNNRSDFSISFSINFTGLNNNGPINTNHIISGDRPGLEGAVALSYQKNQNLWRFVLNNNLFDFSDASIVTGKWYEVAITRNAAGVIKMFLNGVQYPSTYTNTSATNITSLILGQETDCTGSCFDATQCAYSMIDNFKIYSGAIVATGISELSSADENYQVYPNPAVSGLNIHTASASTIEVRNQLGMLVLSDKLQEGDQQISVRDWQEGIYFVRLSDNTTSKLFRIVVTH